MTTPQLALRTTASLILALALSVFFSLGLPPVRARVPQGGANTPRAPYPRPSFPRPSLDGLDDTMFGPELTYTNSVYGFSFKFPGGFTFWQSSDMEQAPRGKYYPHSDPGEMILATVVIPSGLGLPSIMSVGVNSRISEASCASLVARDQWTSGAALTLEINGLKFTGRTEVDKSPQLGIQNNYQRQYTAYSRRVCFEFESDFGTLDPSRTRRQFGMAGTSVDLDHAFSEMESILQTVNIETTNAGAANSGAKRAHVTRPWETSLAFPKELAELDDLADWKITYPPRARASMHFKICGQGDYDRYSQISFVGGASPDLDDAAANAVVDKLNSEVIQLLRKLEWKLMKSSPGDPNSVCYGRDSVFVTTGDKGTDRCTMNSPCNVSDILNVNVYIPASSRGTQ